VLDYVQGRSKIVDIKEFEVIHGRYKIYKFLFDDEESSDEEEVLFFCDEYGVILARWLDEGLGTSFEYDKVSSGLVNQILNDTTGFYMEKIAPPPPRPAGER
jgi:hypothetical protein